MIYGYNESVRSDGAIALRGKLTEGRTKTGESDKGFNACHGMA